MSYGIFPAYLVEEDLRCLAEHYFRDKRAPEISGLVSRKDSSWIDSLDVMNNAFKNWHKNQKAKQEKLGF
jgi:hypothetical protein